MQCPVLLLVALIRKKQTDRVLIRPVHLLLSPELSKKETSSNTQTRWGPSPRVVALGEVERTASLQHGLTRTRPARMVPISERMPNPAICTTRTITSRKDIATTLVNWTMPCSAMKWPNIKVRKMAKAMLTLQRMLQEQVLMWGKVQGM